ncbi:outer membrane beta-barrel protein [bacterium]|nr:outer membrane beta-barrel protein [bacterium]
MKGHGLLAGMIVGVLIFASLASAGSDISIFQTERVDLPHKFGIQITGSGSMFAMDDVNNYFLTPIDNIQRNDYNEAELGIGGGLALLYRSHENFRWHIGYNYLGQDKFEGSFTNLEDGTTATNEHVASGGEFYVAGHYMMPFGDAFHVFIGGGVSLINAKIDRITSQNEFDPAIYDASGTGLGIRASLGAEFMLTEMFGITGAIGYRLANVPNLEYEDLTGSLDEEGNFPIEAYVWDANNNRTRKIAVDFSGAFLELGIRTYFDAATGWYAP